MTGDFIQSEASGLPSSVLPPTPHGSISAQMVDAGVAVLWELAGEVSKATLAEQVFLAMSRASKD